MPNSRQTSVMASPSRSRATKRRRSSMTELAFHGIHTSRRTKAESVTHVSGTKCHLCLGSLIRLFVLIVGRSQVNHRFNHRNVPTGLADGRLRSMQVVGVVMAVGVLHDFGQHAQESGGLPDRHAALHQPGCRGDGVSGSTDKKSPKAYQYQNLNPGGKPTATRGTFF